MQKSKIEWMPENPYPEKIFPDLDAESQSAVNFVISGLGLTPDRVFGSWGRQVWDSLCREMERRGEAAKEIGLQQSEGELISANDTYAATEGVLTAQFTPQIWIAVGAKAQLAHDKQRMVKLPSEDELSEMVRVFLCLPAKETAHGLLKLLKGERA